MSFENKGVNRPIRPTCFIRKIIDHQKVMALLYHYLPESNLLGYTSSESNYYKNFIETFSKGTTAPLFVPYEIDGEQLSCDTWLDSKLVFEPINHALINMNLDDYMVFITFDKILPQEICDSIDMMDDCFIRETAFSEELLNVMEKAGAISKRLSVHSMYIKEM